MVTARSITPPPCGGGGFFGNVIRAVEEILKILEGDSAASAKIILKNRNDYLPSFELETFLTANGRFFQ